MNGTRLMQRCTSPIAVTMVTKLVQIQKLSCWNLLLYPLLRTKARIINNLQDTSASWRVYWAYMIMLVTQSTNRWYLTVSAILFTVVAVAHLALIILQLPATIGEYVIPYEINGLLVILTGYLATRGFLAAHRL